MKKLLFLIATTALLCSCDKITIKENEIVDTYWKLHSRYTEYIKDGKEVSLDYTMGEVEGGAAHHWHFKDGAEMIDYVYAAFRPLFYYTHVYNIDLKKTTLDIDDRTYTICKFTDSELIIEYRDSQHSSGDPNALCGERYRRHYPKEGAFDKYIPYEELPDEDKNPSN